MSSYFISVNLVPRPPPDFILLAAVEKKLGEGLGIIASHGPEMVDSVST